jgi:hypothetical protein
MRFIGIAEVWEKVFMGAPPLGVEKSQIKKFRLVQLVLALRLQIKNGAMCLLQCFIAALICREGGA